jgi:hypothetical protein
MIPMKKTLQPRTVDKIWRHEVVSSLLSYFEMAKDLFHGFSYDF